MGLGKFTLVTLLFQFCYGNIDLYLPKNEVEQLFGVENMQMYYIRDGVINHNAINFKPHMQPDKDSMLFVWKTTYPDIKVAYEVEQEIVNESETSSKNYSMALEMKRLVQDSSIDIKQSGWVPQEEKEFHVHVPCTGAKTGEVTVKITLKLHMNLDENPSEFNEIIIHRLKKCVKKESYSENGDINNNNSGKTVDKKLEEDPKIEAPFQPDIDYGGHSYNRNDHSTQSSGSFFISISVLTAVIILTLVVVFIVWKSRSSRKQQNTAMNPCIMGMNGGTQQNQFLRPDLPNNAQVMQQGANWMQLTPIINDLGTDISEIRSKLSSIAIPRNDVVNQEVLQEGTFARIFKGELQSGSPVLIKTVSNVASEEQVRLLLYESSLLRGLHHRNILPIKNVVVEGPDPPLIIFPYVKGGNLKRYLQDLKLTDPVSNNSIFSDEHQNKYEQASTQDLVEIGIQVACGMSYMIKRGLVHKDLATRNCVIDAELRVKITDNALSRDLFPDDYCCLGDNENRPVRWLALESLVHKVYSSSSDVWSFGVLLWELQSFAAMPYDDIDEIEMSVYLKDGYRLSQPVNCPDHLYDIMAQCWHYSSDKRPKFSQILQMLTEFHAELGEYV